MYVATTLKIRKKKVHSIGIELNDKCIYTFQFADNQVVIAKYKENIQYTVGKLIEGYNYWRLSVIIKKNKIFVY